MVCLDCGVGVILRVGCLRLNPAHPFLLNMDCVMVRGFLSNYVYAVIVSSQTVMEFPRRRISIILTLSRPIYQYEQQNGDCDNSEKP